MSADVESEYDEARGDGLDGLRQELDAIDAEFVDLLVRRQNAVKRVAGVKSRTDAPLRDVLREARQIARLAERARSQGLDELFVVRLFREIIDFSVRTQELHLGPGHPGNDPTRPITVVFQGAEGAFSHIAGRRFFGPRPAPVTYRGLPTFRAILEEVRSGAADYAMLPIENTTSGSAWLTCPSRAFARSIRIRRPFSSAPRFSRRCLRSRSSRSSTRR
jgi:chorismate mutase/prephenate dehydratase